jgi:hypothetical protein
MNTNRAAYVLFTRLFALGLVACFAVMVLLGGSSETETWGAQGTHPEAGTSYGEKVAARHGCWTDEAPKGVVPTHVVVTLDGEVAPSYRGRVATGKALNYLFGTKAESTASGVQSVTAFCR